MSLSGSRIFFQSYLRGGLQEGSLSYDNPSEVERVARKYTMKGMHLLTKGGRGLTPEECFDAVVTDGTYTVVVVPRKEEDINRLLIASGVGSVEDRQMTAPKRRMITER